jgi:hypothetical protein
MGRKIAMRPDLRDTQTGAVSYTKRSEPIDSWYLLAKRASNWRSHSTLQGAAERLDIGRLEIEFRRGFT